MCRCIAIFLLVPDVIGNKAVHHFEPVAFVVTDSQVSAFLNGNNYQEWSMWHWYAQRRALKQSCHHSESAEFAGRLVRSYGVHRKTLYISCTFLRSSRWCNTSACFTEIEHEAKLDLCAVWAIPNPQCSVLASPFEQMLACDCEQSCCCCPALNELSRTAAEFAFEQFYCFKLSVSNKNKQPACPECWTVLFTEMRSFQRCFLSNRCMFFLILTHLENNGVKIRSADRCPRSIPILRCGTLGFAVTVLR